MSGSPRVSQVYLGGQTIEPDASWRCCLGFCSVNVTLLNPETVDLCESLELGLSLFLPWAPW